MATPIRWECNTIGIAIELTWQCHSLAHVPEMSMPFVFTLIL
jgi:hypothetical protein